MLQKFQESIDDLSLALSVYKKEAGESKEKKRILIYK